MCLNIKSGKQKRHSRRKYAYKVVEKNRKSIWKPNRDIFYHDGATVLSDRECRQLSAYEMEQCSIDHGIHVYTAFENALHNNNIYWGNICTIIRVEVNEKDHVADSAGGSEAVYMKVKVIGEAKL